jgi:gas vesicle protein
MHLEHYEPQTSSSWRGSMLMFVAGTAIGAVAALMMAPTSGRESRAYLRRQSARWPTMSPRKPIASRRP